MSHENVAENLELKVEDFGPIAEARIDLRPLTVFVGPSNTGKSYLAILVYALHRYFSSYGWRYRDRWSWRDESGSAKSGALSQSDIVSIAAWAEQAFVTDTSKTSTKEVLLPDFVAELVRSDLAIDGASLCGEILRCFGINRPETLVRHRMRSGSQIVVRRRLNDGSISFQHEQELGSKRGQKGSTTTKNTPISIHASARVSKIIRRFTDRILMETNEHRNHFDATRLLRRLADLSLPQFVAPLNLRSFYLPADRTGVMHAHSVVVRALIRSAAKGGISEETEMLTLSGVLADFLDQLIEASPSSLDWRGPFHALSEQMEDNILQGSVHVEKSEPIDYPHFTYRPKGWRFQLPLMNASSMVSELAPVILYLRYVVDSDSLLIIEEPEAHLHPAMQVEFTRQLAMLINSGMRVMVTTHSEWVLEELTNLVLASRIPETIQKANRRGRLALKSEDVGAWFFKPKKRPKGSVIEEIDLKQAGLYSSSFNEVATAIHNEWAEISSLAKEPK